MGDFMNILFSQSMFKNIAATIEQALARGARSRYLTEEASTLVGGMSQVFEKNGNIVVKHYRPSKGTIDTAFFSGDKAKLIKKDGYYEGITQPDKLVTQLWRNNPFTEHTLYITKPFEKLNMEELFRGIHKPQITKKLRAISINDKVHYNISSYQTRCSSGCWSAGLERV